MKKIIALLLVFASLAMMFVACGDDKEETKTEDKADGGNKQDPTEALVGVWENNENGQYTVFNFEKGGIGKAFLYTAEKDIVWSFDNDRLTVYTTDSDEKTELYTDVECSVSSTLLVINNNGEQIKFMRAASYAPKIVSDWTAVKTNGKIICGITEYAPMNYYEDGVLVGFDTELSKAVAEYLDVEVEFISIDWDNKYEELENGNIDLVWNGFTKGMEGDVSREEYVDYSCVYLENRQCVVTKADRLEELNTKEAFAGKKAAVESGSFGEIVSEELAGDNEKVVGFANQADALKELAFGTVDFAVVDRVLAEELVGKGDYSALSINNAYVPDPESYVVACRNDSDLTEKINEAIKALAADGTLEELAIKYELENDLVSELMN